jgi:hypothetical protein
LGRGSIDALGELGICLVALGTVDGDVAPSDDDRRPFHRRLLRTATSVDEDRDEG